MRKAVPRTPHPHICAPYAPLCMSRAFGLLLRVTRIGAGERRPQAGRSGRTTAASPPAPAPSPPIPKNVRRKCVRAYRSLYQNIGRWYSSAEEKSEGQHLGHHRVRQRPRRRVGPGASPGASGPRRGKMAVRSCGPRSANGPSGSWDRYGAKRRPGSARMSPARSNVTWTACDVRSCPSNQLIVPAAPLPAGIARNHRRDAWQFPPTACTTKTATAKGQPVSLASSDMTSSWRPVGPPLP